MGSKKAAARVPTRDLPDRGRNGFAGQPDSTSGASLADAPPIQHPSQTVRRALYLMARKAFPSDAALAEAIGVHRSQITRWKTGDPANPENAWLLRDFAFAAETLVERFDAGAAHAWLQGRSPELNGETPTDAIRGGRVADVLMAIQAQASGAYS